LVTNEGGIDYSLHSNLEGLIILTRNIQGMTIFLLPGLLIPVSMIYPFYQHNPKYRSDVFRSHPEWRRWYVIVLPAAMLLVAFVANVVIRNLTPRNMMILIPPLVVLGAYQLRALRWEVRLIPIALIAVMGVFIFHGYSPNIPYQQTVQFISETYEDGDLVVTNINHHGAGATAMTYYLVDWLPGDISKEDMFHFVEPEIRATFAVAPDPLPEGSVVKDDNPETLARFRAFLDGADRVFFITYYGPPLYRFTPLTETYLHILEDELQYQAVRQEVFDTPYPESVEQDTYTVVEYRRITRDEMAGQDGEGGD
jgi:hypothetical protein